MHFPLLRFNPYIRKNKIKFLAIPFREANPRPCVAQIGQETDFKITMKIESNIIGEDAEVFPFASMAFTVMIFSPLSRVA